MACNTAPFLRQFSPCQSLTITAQADTVQWLRKGVRATCHLRSQDLSFLLHCKLSVLSKVEGSKLFQI